MFEAVLNVVYNTSMRDYLEKLKQYFAPEDNTIRDASLLTGGGVLGAGVGGKAFLDFTKLENTADAWDAKGKVLDDVLSSKTYTFKSPLSGKLLKRSPEDFDLAHALYHEGTSNVLNNKLLGAKVEGIYNIPTDYMHSRGHVQGWMPKEKPLILPGIFDFAGGQHNHFQGAGSRQVSLAHFLRDFALPKSTRDVIFDTKAVPRNDEFLDMMIDDSARKIYNEGHGSFKKVTDGDTLFHKIIDEVANSPKVLKVNAADKVLANKDKHTELSPLLKKLGITEDNFSVSNVYNKLVEAYNTTSDKKEKSALRKGIRGIELTLLSESNNNGKKMDWVTHFTKNQGPAYARIARIASKIGKPVAGAVGLAGTAAAGAGLGMLGNELLSS